MTSPKSEKKPAAKNTGGRNTASSKSRSAAASKAAQTRKENEEKRALLSEVRGFLMLFAGALLLYFIFTKENGKLGAYVAMLLQRLFGYTGRVILASALCLCGLKVLLRRPGGQIWFWIAAFSVSSGISVWMNEFSLYAFSEKTLYRDLWEVRSSGGFVIGFIAKVLRENLQVWGSYIVLGALLVVSAIFIFRTSIVSVVKTGADKVIETAEEISKKLPARTLDFEESVKKNREKKRIEREKSTIDMRRARTVLETSSGDKLIYVKKGALKPGAGDFFDDGASSPKKVPVVMKMDDFDPDRVPAGTPKKPRREEKKPAADPVGSIEKIARKKAEETAAAVKEEPEEKKVTAAENEAAREEITKKISETSAFPEVNYKFPPYSLLTSPEAKGKTDDSSLRESAVNLIKALDDFGVEAEITDVTVGPAVTRFELSIQSGTRVRKVADLSDDIAYALAAKQVRIEAPIPGKSAVGIEIPNDTARTVRLSEIIRDRKFTQSKSALAVALGETLTGEALVMDIKKMPHMLIAGATGSGKSVCINTIIISILYHSAPSDVRMILIDPKMVELNVYNGIPHLLIPVVTNPKEAGGALGWAVREMESRYERFKENKVRDIESYNAKALAAGEEKMPYIVLIIDELSDLMMVAAQQVETYICRLAQLARAAGIHLILATQRPSVNVITGLIKANISSRISFAVTSQIDSRTILDRGGAEKLLGRGDMLYKPIDENQPLRAQCAYVDDDEIEKIVDFIRSSSGEASYSEEIQEEIRSAVSEPTAKQAVSEDREDEDDDDVLIRKAMEIAFQNKGKISTSLIQRKLRVGYSRAGRLVDEMEERGYISQPDGSKPREVLVSYEEIFGDDE